MTKTRLMVAMSGAFALAFSAGAVWEPGEPVTTYWFGPGCPGTTPCFWQSLFKISPERPYSEVKELERHADTTLATHLVSSDGRSYLMFVNCDYKKDRTINVKVPCVAERFDPLAGTWSPAGAEFDLSLIRGGGVLIRLADVVRK